MDPNIRPICLYQNYNSYSSYVGYPIKKDGKFVCAPKSGTRFIVMFYTVDERMSTAPPGMTMLCFRDTPEIEYSTIDIDTVYDPFHHTKNCLRFFAWVSPVPYSTPLFIWKRGKTIHINLTGKQPPGFEPEVFSPIYVLIDPRAKVPRVPGFNGVPNKFIIKNNLPQFRFSGYQGRCIPDPNGMTIGKCMVLYGKNILSPKNFGQEPTLLKFLDRMYNNDLDENFFGKIRILPGLILVTILVFSVIFIVLKLN